MNPPARSLSRRRFLKTTASAALLGGSVRGEAAAPVHQATGTRAGEVTDTSANVWTRLTQKPDRNEGGIPMEMRVDRKANQKLTIKADDILGACPGLAGRIRLRYGLNEDLSDAVETEWMPVTEATDFIHQFKLEGLRAGSTYHFASETADDNGIHGQFRGRFHTAPAADSTVPLRFCVMTCQGYHDRDHPDGHPIYPAMQSLDPKFITMTGDLVYYDNDAPLATTPRLARLHWERMFSLPRLKEALRQTSTYWLKDDHDTLNNDSKPGDKAGDLTFEEGQRIFQQQAPMGPQSYRTFRWGRDLQIWFTDGRDFRSSQQMADGPEKTIWGAEQKAWFKQTVKESDATWKILISPTPLVGPDRTKKNDNHSNAGFAHEGNELRTWLQENVPDHFFVVCGDRHWQYHSVHPETGVQEFSVGPASNAHASGSPGENKRFHRFHRVKGGFLSVDLHREGGESVLQFQLRDVKGTIVYEAPFRRPVG